MPYIKVVVINVLLTLLLLLIIELAVTLSYFELSAVKEDVTCDSSLTFYDYCPDIIHFQFMHKSDRLLPTYNYIDSARRSTYADRSAKPQVQQARKVFLIGDSFIQADELFIEERMEHRFRLQGFETIARGYSSWNSNQFQRIAASGEAESGDVMFLFSMTNDFTPDYRSSTIRADTASVADEVRSATSESMLTSYLQQSFLNNRLKPLVMNLFTVADARHRSGPISISHDEGNSNNCASLPRRDDVASALAHNYLELSKQAFCWSDPVKQSVDLNVRLLRDMISGLSANGVAVHIVLVPAGWAFENQNTIGRTAAPYQFPAGLQVTHQGLFDYLRAQNLPVVDATEILGPHAQRENELYFAADGHWNQRAHEIMFKALLPLVQGRPQHPHSDSTSQ